MRESSEVSATVMGDLEVMRDKLNIKTGERQRGVIRGGEVEGC